MFFCIFLFCFVLFCLVWFGLVVCLKGVVEKNYSARSDPWDRKKRHGRTSRFVSYDARIQKGIKEKTISFSIIRYANPVYYICIIARE